MDIGVGLQVLVPTGSFNQNITSIPVGLAGHYYHRIGSQFMLGAELSAACISHNSYEIELPDGETGKLSVDENMWGMMIGSRFNFIGTSAMRTYTEVRVGINTFYTSVSSCAEELQQYQEERTHGTSFVSSIGLGLDIDPKALFTNKSGRTWIAFRGAYVAGTDVSYRNAPESNIPTPLDSHINNSSIGYFEVGLAASWQLR